MSIWAIEFVSVFRRWWLLTFLTHTRTHRLSLSLTPTHARTWTPRVRGSGRESAEIVAFAKATFRGHVPGSALRRKKDQNRRRWEEERRKKKWASINHGLDALFSLFFPLSQPLSVPPTAFEFWDCFFIRLAAEWEKEKEMMTSAQNKLLLMLDFRWRLKKKSQLLILADPKRPKWHNQKMSAVKILWLCRP